jgi:hypothetical protein
MKAGNRIPAGRKGYNAPTDPWLTLTVPWRRISFLPCKRLRPVLSAMSKLKMGSMKAHSQRPRSFTDDRVKCP